MNKKIKEILNKKNKTKIVSAAYSKNVANILDKHCYSFRRLNGKCFI